MKNFLKLTALSALFIITSCAHHGGCKSCDSQCEMHKDSKKEQCGMKGEHKDMKDMKDMPAAEAPAKK